MEISRTPTQHQENPKRYQKKKKKATVVNVRKMSQKTKKKSLLSIAGNIIEWEKNALLQKVMT